MEYSIKLSVLICHLNERKEQLANLLKNLDAQSAGKPIEVLVESDNRGEHTVGSKRNALLLRAKGEYIAFIDDDDDVASNYVDEILSAIERGDHPDCIGVVGKLFITGKGSALFRHSLAYAGWYESGSAFYRTPNHLNPVRRELALQVMFKADMNIGEDRDYSDRLHPLLETEERVDSIIYYYDCTRYSK